MLGPRTGREQGSKRKRKWEEDDKGESDDEQDAGPAISAKDLEEWKEREKLEEQKAEQTRPAGEAATAPASTQSLAPYAPAPVPSMPPPRTGPGLRLGEGDDTSRSRDEIRIIKEMLAEEIERFIMDNRIDGPAARDLRVEPVHVQFAVLDRGPLTSCVNPSGALIGRIRDAKKGVRHGGGPTAIHQSIQVPLPASTPAMSPPSGGLTSGGHPPAGTPVLAALAGAASSPELERFITENRLDQGASMSLRGESKEIQDKVISMGPLINAVNPSAALMGRIRTVRSGGGGGLRTGPPPMAALPPMLPMLPQGGFPPPPHMCAPPVPGVPFMPSPAPPLSDAVAEALQGTMMASTAPGRIEDSRLNEEARKAIQSLTGSRGGAYGGFPGTMPAANWGNFAFAANPADASLNEEALRALDGINSDEL